MCQLCRKFLSNSRINRSTLLKMEEENGDTQCNVLCTLQILKKFLYHWEVVKSVSGTMRRIFIVLLLINV